MTSSGQKIMLYDVKLIWKILGPLMDQKLATVKAVKFPGSREKMPLYVL